MRRRAVIAGFTLIATLIYVSGLALNLHVAWAHGGATEPKGGEHQRHACTEHGHHGHHSHHHEPEAPADEPASDECPTCVALALHMADAPIAFAPAAFHFSLAHVVGIEGEEAAHLGGMRPVSARGPPLIHI